MLAMNCHGFHRVRAEQKFVLAFNARVGTTSSHEFTRAVEKVAVSREKLKVGNQVPAPFNVFCGACHFGQL